MLHNYSSVKEVIGNVLRNTRVQDTSYIMDMPEWIGHAMTTMRTRMELVWKYKDLKVDFHAAHLPCGTINVEGVEYAGYKLSYSERIPSYNKKVLNSFSKEQPTLFQTVVVADTDTTTDITTIFPTTLSLEQLNRLPTGGETYFIEGNCIKTSFSDGCIRVHYKALQTDEDGFPLVPDNANYKQALYWHCRAMMIGAGYKDEVFNYGYCDAQYEKYAARAIAGIRYPSTDIMASRIPDITKYLPNNFFSFFSMV